MPRICAAIVAAVLTVVCGNAAADQSLELTGGFKSVGAVGGWPSFVTLKDNSIMAVRGRTCYTSADGGRTWDGPKPLMSDDVKLGIMGINRLKSGKLGAVMLRVEGIPNIGRDKDNFRCMTLAYGTSADDGKTWAKPVQINRYFTHGVPHVDNVVQTTKGRIVIPVRTGFTASDKVRKNAGSWATFEGKRRKIGGHTTYPEIDIAFCYLSDDEGQTWRKSNGYIFGWPQSKKLGAFACDEPVIVELRDGRLLILARTTIGQIYFVYSDDGGESWGVPVPSGLAGAYAPCRIRKIPSTGDLVLVWNQVSREEIESGYERNRLSVAISKDDAKTWEHAKTLFRSHVPAVGLLKPGPVAGHIGMKPFVGELPRDFATGDYPNAHIHGDNILIHYDRNPKFLGGAYWTLHIFPLSALYE